MRSIFIVLCLMLVLTACRSAVPFPTPQLSKTQQLELSELLEGNWALASGTVRMKHTVLLELGWRKLPMVGLLELDRDQRKIRLIALNDMSLKLFDLAVTADGYETNYLFPKLAGYDGLAETVANSVRKIFLDPLPQSDDQLAIESDRYRTQRNNGSGELTFTFGGDRRDLLVKGLRGADQEWYVNYYDYRDLPAGRLPGGVILEDEKAGYRLTLWLEKAKRIDG